MMSISPFLFPLAAYLFGSVPSGIIIARALGLKDPRSSGSGNIGAANLTRIGGKKVGAATFVFDFLKGLIPVLAAVLYLPDNLPVACLAALLSVTGHCYSVFLGFNGGKGVATTAGAFLPLAPISMLFALIAWAGTFYAFKISSLSAMVALIVLLALMLALSSETYLFLAALAACLMVVRRHQKNLLDLLSAQERTF